MARRQKQLKRSRAKREPRRIFHILCEGRKTEPGYLGALKRITRDTLIDLRVAGGVGVPLTLAEESIEIARNLGLSKKSRKRLNSFEEKDRVWVVFDRDEHPGFQEAVDKCTAANVGVARSNPCFELWLILHYEDYDRPLDHHNVQAHFEKIDPVYSRSNGKIADFDFLIAHISDAEDRAFRQLQRRQEERAPYEAPSTTVFVLTREVLEAAKKFRDK